MIVTLLGLWLTLLLAEGTPTGRLLRRGLVEWPAARLARIARGTVLAWLILGAIGVLCVWLFEQEGLRLFTMALPEIASWISMFEIGALVDALALAAMAASTLRLGAMRRWIAARLPARRAQRARRVRPTARASNDDEDPGPALLAA